MSAARHPHSELQEHSIWGRLGDKLVQRLQTGSQALDGTQGPDGSVWPEACSGSRFGVPVSSLGKSDPQSPPLPTALLPAGFKYLLCLHGPLCGPSVHFTGETLGEADSSGNHLSLLLPGRSATPVPPAVRNTACVI